jgi:hypothetical protein
VQQPAGHELASQTQTPVVVLHLWPAEHCAHELPPAPQIESPSPLPLPRATQLPDPLQQPLQEVPLHVHVPVAEQVCPMAALHAPQAAPPAPHVPAFWLP